MTMATRKIKIGFTAAIAVLVIIISSFSKKHSLRADKMYPYSHAGILTEPALFAEGVIDTRDDEFGGTFSPDGKTCYFSKSVLPFYLDVICFSKFKDGKWQ